MKPLISLILLLFVSISSNACCSESISKIYPLGEYEEGIVYLKFNGGRRCIDQNGRGNEGSHKIDREGNIILNYFQLFGVASLVTQSDSIITTLQILDTIRMNECECEYKDHYKKNDFESLFKSTYDKAFTEANKLSGFNIATPKDIIFNDTLTRTQNTDSTYVITYRDIFSEEIPEWKEMDIGQYLTIRTYETKTHTIKIITAKNKTREDEQNHIMHRFQKIKTAYWKEGSRSHRATIDRIYIFPK